MTYPIYGEDEESTSHEERAKQETQATVHQQIASRELYDLVPIEEKKKIFFSCYQKNQSRPTRFLKSSVITEGYILGGVLAAALLSGPEPMICLVTVPLGIVVGMYFGYQTSDYIRQLSWNQLVNEYRNKAVHYAENRNKDNLPQVIIPAEFQDDTISLSTTALTLRDRLIRWSRAGSWAAIGFTSTFVVTLIVLACTGGNSSGRPSLNDN